MVRVDDTQRPVFLVGVVVRGVLQVQLVAEQVPDHLGSLVHTGNPLVHRNRGAVEIPLQVLGAGINIDGSQLTVRL